MSKQKRIKKRIYDIIEIGNRSDVPSLLFDIFIVIVIISNLLITLMSTFDELYAYWDLFHIIELTTIIIFTVEYILRLYTADIKYPDKSFLGACFGFIFSFYGIVDLLTFFPFYLPFIFPSGAVAFRMLRVIRIFRLFKVNATTDAFSIIRDVLEDKKNQIISSMCMIFILMLGSSLGIYSLEHDAQPEAFANAFSGIWWSVSTLLTVGYGDIYPITIGGKIMGICTAFLGVGLVAIPTGIISAGFVEHYTKESNRENISLRNSLEDGENDEAGLEKKA